MANPQLENGYLKIANEIIDKLCISKLNQNEWNILFLILRKTYGWNLKKNKISFKDFKTSTDLNDSNICRAINKLKSKKMIIVEGNLRGRNKINTYEFNKNYDEWEKPKKENNRALNFKKNKEKTISCEIKEEKKLEIVQAETKIEEKIVKKEKINNEIKYTKEFEEAWSLYKHRPDDNKQAGFRNWKTKLKNGEKIDNLFVAISNYKKFCEIKKIDDVYLKKFSNFFGRDEDYKQYINFNFENLKTVSLKTNNYLEKQNESFRKATDCISRLGITKK